MKQVRLNDDGSLQVTSSRGENKEYLSSVMRYRTLGAPMGVGGRSLVFIKDEIFEGQGVSQPVLDAQDISAGELTMTWDNLDSYLPYFGVYNLAFQFGTMDFGSPFTFHFLNSALYAGSSGKRLEGNFSPWYFYQSTVQGGEGVPGNGFGIPDEGPPGGGIPNSTPPIQGQWKFAMNGAQDTTMDFPGIGNNSEIEIRFHLDRAQQIADAFYAEQIRVLNFVPEPMPGPGDPGFEGGMELG